METVKLKSNRLAHQLMIVSAALLLLCCGGYIAWRYFNPPLDRYTPILKQIADHKIVTDDRGLADLSKNFPGLTPKDMAYLTWRADGSFLAMFPTFYGEGTELVGVVYTSRPLKDDDIRLRDSVIHFNDHLISVGSYENLVLDKKLSENWYQVSYKLK